MGIEEFSNGFDTLVNSYARFRDFDDKEPRDTIEFNEYEKSLFLTKGQEEIVLALYNGTLYGKGFEQSEEIRRYLAPLIKDDVQQPITNSSGNKIGASSQFFTIAEDVWFITYESITATKEGCDNSIDVKVVPVTQDQYHNIKNNPFRGATDRKALRLDLADNVVEIVYNNTITSYYYRYIRRPYPIILENFQSTGLTVEGEDIYIDIDNPCELPKSVQYKILDRAVILALQSKGYNINKRE